MPVIEVDSLHKRYREHIAVAEVSFTVERGEVFGILGRNGAGKTTTVECVEGLRRPDGGRISVLGLDPRRDAATLRAKVGVQLQECRLPDRITVREALQLYATFYPDPLPWRQLLADLGLSRQANTRFEKLSGGQQQRLSIALALIGNPEIAILDELTTGLDPQARKDTWALIEDIRDRGVTILLVTHFMAEAERLCDRIAVLEAGRVAAIGSPAELVSTVDSAQTVRFRPSAALDSRLLTALPEVTGIRRDGAEFTVTGHGNLLHALTSALAAQQVIPIDLRLERATLDDAFLALTGRRLDEAA
ncbi:ABC transporter ATP-binding protein [Crossiella cryophila]|uniref:ABC-2 type transport system ATP-binding protein n=1 Tax=Crossiella cryophila TaxID=43355 RepID=A0A7W7CG37_9PSEU|nr:ABC transporter ATP-binding protein [Crossiella cryophila]MBB4678859.1 ABC-2 type transport system ATP-binding protein [Crossiella cryophila]